MAPSTKETPSASKEELAAMIMQLKQELDQLKAANSPSAGGYAAKIKAPRPEAYDGNREGLQAFITQCDAYLSVNDKAFEYECDRVLCVAGMLKGRAAEWFEPTLRDFLDNRHARAKRRPETLAIF